MTAWAVSNELASTVITTNKSGYSQLPNRLAPEAWLLPEENRVVQFYTHVAIGGLSVMIWDIVQSFPEELQLIASSRLSWPLVTYFVARISPLSLLLSCVIPAVSQSDNCTVWTALYGLSYTLYCASVGLLFYFRVRAVYLQNQWFLRFVPFAWLLCTASAVVFVANLRFKRVEPTNRCEGYANKNYPLSMVFVQSLYDVMVCAAITHKLGSRFVVDEATRPASWKVTFKRPLTFLSRRFLQDSQIYFVITAVFKILQLTLYFAVAGVNDLVHVGCALGILDGVVISILAAKIFRKFKLGKPGFLAGIQPEPVTTFAARSSIHFNPHLDQQTDSF